MAGLKKARRAKAKQTAKAQQYQHRAMTAENFSKPAGYAQAADVSPFVMTTDTASGSK